MSIAPTLAKYLDQHVVYDVVVHDPTLSSMRTAEVCHIPGDSLVKGVVVRRDGEYLLALLPATHHIQLSELKKQLGNTVDLASENEIDVLFRDCVHGAVPPIGECYGLDLIVDDSIDLQSDVYLEGGDHQTLVHMDQAQFAAITADALHGRFSSRD